MGGLLEHVTPASRERSSPTTIATVVSSMLNSMWTMFILYWELCGCSKKLSSAQCCCTVIRSVYESQTLLSICYCGCCGCATTSRCDCLCLGQCHRDQPSLYSGQLDASTESNENVNICKRLTLYVGRILLLGIIFVIFLGIFCYERHDDQFCEQESCTGTVHCGSR